MGIFRCGGFLPLRVAAVTFVAKQKSPKVDLETKVSKNFLSANPLEISDTYRRRGKTIVCTSPARCRYADFGRTSSVSTTAPEQACIGRSTHRNTVCTKPQAA